MPDNNFYEESLYPYYRQSFSVDQLLFEQKTDYQSLVFFHNVFFGTVMALDGIIQTTEKDEAFYHEMIVHVPLIAHPDPKRVLIIGGGDGGSLRELVKYPNIEAIMVEIDPMVIDISKQYLPKHSDGAFEHPGAQIIIDDGIEYVKKHTQSFDVIICDSTDPTGPGEVLFTQSFYEHCFNALKENGIFVGQSGVPFFQKEEQLNVAKNLKAAQFQTTFYQTVVPSYVGGFMILSFAQKGTIQTLDSSLLESRMQSRLTLNKPLEYYNTAIHQGAFALPNFIKLS